MSVISTVRAKRQWGLDQHVTINLTYSWMVTTDDPDDEGDVAEGGVPIAIGDRLALGVDSWCIGKVANCVSDDGCTWEVTVTFGNPSSDSDLPPWERPAEYQWTFDKQKRIIQVDKDGNDIVNSAGMPFFDPVEVEDLRPCYTIKKSYEGGYDKSVYLSYRGAVNSGSWNGGAARVWRLCDMSIQSHNDKKWGYYEDVQFTFIAAPYGQEWKVVVADLGLKYLSGGKLIPIKIGGKETTEPIPLNGSGGLLTVGSAFHYLTYYVYQELDFSIFNIT